MKTCLKFYIDGAWVEPAQSSSKPLDVLNPATEQPIGQIMLGTAADVDKAVAAAKKAFPAFSNSSREDRLALLDKIVAAYEARIDEMAEVITQEMGAPAWLSKAAQAPMGVAHFKTTQAILKNYTFESMQGTTQIRKEPVGVCGFITPWNWPVNQIACKVAPALAAGCTMVLKPSEISPLSGYLFAEILDAAGVPAGVFNLINGDGPTVGAAMSAHPDIDMMSFTGSTRAGI
ncbi:MAG: aldehyde dehydrogenase family protein, partial [Hyphomicrobiales bacterium]|nr:aldehyde dehydrogenase family protein [Hyphomicrobiales bacterium]